MWQGPAVSFRRRTPAMEGLVIVYAVAFPLCGALLSFTLRMLIRTTIIWERHSQHRDIFVSLTACKTWCVRLALITHRHKSGLWASPVVLHCQLQRSLWPISFLLTDLRLLQSISLMAENPKFKCYCDVRAYIGFLGIFFRLVRLSQRQPLTHLALLICELELKGVWTVSLEDWLGSSRAPGSQQDSCPHDEDTTFTSLVNGKESLQG